MKKKINIKRGINSSVLLAEPRPDAHLRSPPRGTRTPHPEAGLQARHGGQSGPDHQLQEGKAPGQWRACSALAPGHRALTARPWLWVGSVAGGCLVFLGAGVTSRWAAALSCVQLGR